LFAYGYLAALPFIILDAKDKIELDGVAVGSLITAQMLGAMFSNFIWGKLSSQGKNKLITLISLSLMIIGAIIAMFASHLYIYMLIFALFGASTDGNRISGSNMLLQIAPEDKRPIYVAININILSFGMFFSVIGGVVVHLTNYTILYIFTLLLLLISLFFAFKLEDKD
jgi:MFS family permease